MSRPVKSLIGKSFGDLVVVSYFGPMKPDAAKDKKHAWLCKCVCGNEIIVRSSVLLCANHQSSCFQCARKNNGLKYSNLIGQKFGRLLVTSKAERPDVKNGSQYWNVKCDCGVEKIVSTGSLKSATTVSCGCFNRENAKKIHTTHGLSSNWKEYNKLRRSDPCEKLKHRIGCTVRKHLKINGGIKNCSVWQKLNYSPEELKTHLEQLWEPWMNWDNYGGTSNSLEQTWWIDHIKPQSLFVFESLDDNQFLDCWALSNLRPLEKKMNMSKGDKIWNM